MGHLLGLSQGSLGQGLLHRVASWFPCPPSRHVCSVVWALLLEGNKHLFTVALDPSLPRKFSIIILAGEGSRTQQHQGCGAQGHLEAMLGGG